MLDLKFVRENFDLVQQMLRNRRSDTDLSGFEALDDKRRRVLHQVEQLKYRRNVASEEISQLKREKQDASQRIDEMREVSQQIKELDQQLAVIEQEFEEILLLIPNMPHDTVADWDR